MQNLVSHGFPLQTTLPVTSAMYPTMAVVELITVPSTSRIGNRPNGGLPPATHQTLILMLLTHASIKAI